MSDPGPRDPARSGDALFLRNARLDDGRLVDIGMRAGTITGVEPAGAGVLVPDPAGSELDLAGSLVLPAFAEPHAHLDKALAAERVENPAGDLMGAITAWRGYGHRLTVADIAERAERAARMLAANGTTAIRTHVDVNETVGLRSVEALLQVRDALAGTASVELTALTSFPTAGAEGADQRARLEAALDMGVDQVGGCPHLEPDGAAFIDLVLEMAGERELGLDLHVDETLDPSVLTLETLAERVTATGFASPVMASHCVSLGMQPTAVQRRVADKVAAAGISVVALPQTNLYLQARGEATAPPRGLTAVAALTTAGVNVAAGADNLQDPFNLVGRGDPLETATLMVMAGHLSPDDALQAVSSRARLALDLPPVAVEPGSPAELVAIDAASVREAIATASTARTVIHQGRIVSRRRVVEDAP